MMVAEPPAKGGTQALGTLAPLRHTFYNEFRVAPEAFSQPSAPPSAGPPSAGPPKISIFFFPLPLHFSGSPGLHTTTRELQTRTFEGSGASNTTKIPREDTQRERDKKSENGAGEDKKARNFGRSGGGAGRVQTNTTTTQQQHNNNTTTTQQHNNTTHNKHTTTHNTQQYTTTQTNWPNMDWPKLDWPNGLAKNGLAKIGLAKVGLNHVKKEVFGRLSVRWYIDAFFHLLHLHFSLSFFGATGITIDTQVRHIWSVRTPKARPVVPFATSFLSLVQQVSIRFC